MSLSTIINRLFSLATVQIPVVVNLPDAALCCKEEKRLKYVQSGKATSKRS